MIIPFSELQEGKNQPWPCVLYHMPAQSRPAIKHTHLDQTASGCCPGPFCCRSLDTAPLSSNLGERERDGARNYIKAFITSCVNKHTQIGSFVEPNQWLASWGHGESIRQALSWHLFSPSVPPSPLHWNSCRAKRCPGSLEQEQEHDWRGG